MISVVRRTPLQLWDRVRLWNRVRGTRGVGEWWRFPPLLVAAGVAGAVGEYFLDPQSGCRRRAVGRDRIAAFVRRRRALNDPALEAKVESEIFRDADAPKDRVSVSVEDGVVYLRGELETKKAADGLARSARSVEGVGKVVNLLHRPGEEAPSKENGHGRGDAKRPSGKTRGKATRQAPARSK